MSKTITLHPILLNLWAAMKMQNQALNEKNKYGWKPTTKEQKDFLKEIDYPTCNLDIIFNKDGFSEDELNGIASMNPEDVNLFLKENGFNIELEKQEGDGNVYIASMLNVILKWKQTPEIGKIRIKDKDFKSIKISNTKSTIIKYEVDGQELFEIKQQGANDIIFIAKGDHLSGDCMEKFKKTVRNPSNYIEKFKKMIRNPSDDFFISADRKDYEYMTSICIPMVKYDEEIDISFLNGMRYNDLVIAQALQQTKFNLDENGCVVDSAVAISYCKRAILSDQKVINEPFTMWILREGMFLPYFIGYFTEESFVEIKDSNLESYKDINSNPKEF